VTIGRRLSESKVDDAKDGNTVRSGECGNVTWGDKDTNHFYKTITFFPRELSSGGPRERDAQRELQRRNMK